MTKDPQMQATSWESGVSMSNWQTSSTRSSIPTWTNSVPPCKLNDFMTQKKKKKTKKSLFFLLVSGSLQPSASGSSPVSSSTNDGQKMTTNGIVSILGLGLTFYNLYLN